MGENKARARAVHCSTGGLRASAVEAYVEGLLRPVTSLSVLIQYNVFLSTGAHICVSLLEPGKSVQSRTCIGRS